MVLNYEVVFPVLSIGDKSCTVSNKTLDNHSPLDDSSMTLIKQNIVYFILKNKLFTTDSLSLAPTHVYPPFHPCSINCLRLVVSGRLVHVRYLSLSEKVTTIIIPAVVKPSYVYLRLSF